MGLGFPFGNWDPLLGMGIPLGIGIPPENWGSLFGNWGAPLGLGSPFGISLDTPLSLSVPGIRQLPADFPGNWGREFGLEGGAVSVSPSPRVPGMRIPIWGCLTPKSQHGSELPGPGITGGAGPGAGRGHRSRLPPGGTAESRPRSGRRDPGIPGDPVPPEGPRHSRGSGPVGASSAFSVIRFHRRILRDFTGSGSNGGSVQLPPGPVLPRVRFLRRSTGSGPAGGSESPPFHRLRSNRGLRAAPAGSAPAPGSVPPPLPSRSPP